MDIPVLSRKLTNDIVDLKYPCVKVLEPSDALALMMDRLPKGDLPVVCEYENELYVIQEIENSPITVNHLRKVVAIEWYYDVDTCSELRTPEDVMEVF